MKSFLKYFETPLSIVFFGVLPFGIAYSGFLSEERVIGKVSNSQSEYIDNLAINQNMFMSLCFLTLAPFFFCVFNNARKHINFNQSIGVAVFTTVGWGYALSSLLLTWVVYISRWPAS